MSILGLICVLLALVATLLFVLYLFQRRDLRAISELSLSVQRAVSGERLPQRIEMEPGHESQLDVQALGVSVNQLLMRAARSGAQHRSGPKLFTELGERVHEAVLVHRDVILSSPTWSRPSTRTWSRRTCAAASRARMAPSGSKWRWSACRGR
jgi:hypothetical protein